MDSRPLKDRYLTPGTKVVLRAGQPDGAEYGVVAHCWNDEEIGGWDCYVAFFGNSLPSGKPTEKPYVLRYAATSLDLIEA